MKEHIEIHKEYISTNISDRDSFVDRHCDIKHRFIQKIGIHPKYEQDKIWCQSYLDKLDQDIFIKAQLCANS